MRLMIVVGEGGARHQATLQVPAKKWARMTRRQRNAEVDRFLGDFEAEDLQLGAVEMVTRPTDSKGPRK